TRVAASEWIYQNIPTGSIILSEYWDDALPASTQKTYEKTFRSIQMPVFDPDTPDKWTKLDGMLQNGNYLVLSSNRGWGSIPTVPERYPKMTKFYKDLFDGKLAYKKVAEFTSYPSLSYLGLPIEFPDENLEEAFSVYDHPHVIIFQNTHVK